MVRGRSDPAGTELCRGLDESAGLVRGIDVRQRPVPRARKVAVGGNLVAGVFGVEVAGEVGDPLVVPVSLAWRARLHRPGDGGVGADVLLATGGGKLGEPAQAPLVVREREATGSPPSQPGIDACRQHGAPPSQGCATERSTRTSTLA